MTSWLECHHCRGNLTYAGRVGRRDIRYCGSCGCYYMEGEHSRNGHFHQTKEEKEAVAEAIRRDPQGRELFG